MFTNFRPVCKRKIGKDNGLTDIDGTEPRTHTYRPEGREFTRMGSARPPGSRRVAPQAE